jgi:hypothetical protein
MNGFSPGLPKLNPGLELANTFGVKNTFGVSVAGSAMPSYYFYRVTGRIPSAERAEPT